MCRSIIEVAPIKEKTGGLFMYFKVSFWRRLTKNQKLRLLRQKAHVNLVSKGFIA